MSEIRYDPLHDTYAVIAPERLHRPDCYRLPGHTGQKPTICPFCEGNEQMTPPEIYALRENDPNQPGWLTRVVPNLYKAVQIEAPWEHRQSGLYGMWEGLGAHEVIIDTPRHLTRMDRWRKEEIFNWITTIASRLDDLRRDIRLVHFSIFKNHGSFAAATQEHPHTQLIALPTVPKAFLHSLLNAHTYALQEGRSLFENLLEQELSEKERIITQNEHFVAFCPHASTFAFEVMIMSTKDGVTSLLDCDKRCLDGMVELLFSTMGALYEELGYFDFNLLFNTPPMQCNDETRSFYDAIPQSWRLTLRIVPRLFRMGGFELQSGAQINPVAPEEAARLLKLAMEGVR